MSDNQTLIELQKIHQNLFSTDDKTVQKALASLVSKGTDMSIRPMLELYVTTDNKTYKSVIEKLLFSIKAPNSAVHLIEALKGDISDEHKAFILSVFWNAGIPANAYVVDIVIEAIEGDFVTALEALTIIENMDGDLDPEPLDAARIETDTYLKSRSDDNKYDLIRSIDEILSGFA